MDIAELVATWWPIGILVSALGAVYLAFARSAVAELVVRLAAWLYGSNPDERARWTEEWLRQIEDLNPSERPAHAGSLLWAGVRVSVVRLPKRRAPTDLAATPQDVVAAAPARRRVEKPVRPISGPVSPYARRLRLAAELRALRLEAGLTHEQLAKLIGQSRAQISRLENGHVIDQADIIKILDVLGVHDDRWAQIMGIAREAGERGWWESNEGMGERQAMYANLEAGARTIREFQMTFVPGLLQTPEFTRARVQADGQSWPLDLDVDSAIEARIGRQSRVRRPGGPSYELVLDERALRRMVVPAEVMRAQLYHIAARVNGDPRTMVRILPIDARISGYQVPRSAFTIYTFADPYDPTIVSIDAITSDLLLADGHDVGCYEELYDRLIDAALSVEDSLCLLMELARCPLR